MKPGDSQKSDVLIIGIGNRYRSDDGIGLEVVERLKKLNPKGVKIRAEDGEASKLIEAWMDMEKVIVVDATSSGINPGTIRRYDVKDKSLPADLFHFSTHSFSLADAVEFARALNKLPKNLIIFGIEGKDFSYGSLLSSDVEASIDKVVSLINKEI